MEKSYSEVGSPIMCQEACRADPDNCNSWLYTEGTSCVFKMGDYHSTRVKTDTGVLGGPRECTSCIRCPEEGEKRAHKLFLTVVVHAIFAYKMHED